jgi:hypothetical protein
VTRIVPHVIQQSASHWFEFETEVPSQSENLDTLSRIHRELLAKVEAMNLPVGWVPDIDTEIPFCGEQEHGPCDGHFEPTCYHQLLLFGDQGDCLAARLWPENVPSAKDWDESLLSEVERQQERSTEAVFGGNVAFDQLEISEAPEKQGMTQTFPSDSRSMPEPPNEHPIDQACQAGMEVPREFPALGRPTEAATATSERLKRVRLRSPWWKVAGPAVVAALVIACWIAYSARRRVSPSGTALQKSNALEQQVPFVSPKQLPENSTAMPQTVPGATEEARPARNRGERVRVGENEVDIGEDVTVRYFAPKPAVVPPTGPVPSAAQPADHSLPVPERSVSPKLAR